MISVIIPLYNKGSIIERTIKSVLLQDYDDYEIIVVNDGSTDNSADIVRSINDKHIKLIEQKNGGPSKARNTGVEHAKGKWIVFLDADDELCPNSLRDFANCIEIQKNADFIVAPFYIYNGSSRILMYPYEERFVENAFKEHFFDVFFTRTGAFAAQRQLFLDNPFCETIRRYEDFEVWFRIYHVARIYLISSPSMIWNTEFTEASHGRKDINEDFVGHLNFKGKSFWEKMCLYQLYLGERTLYPGQINKLYPMLKYRYDLLVLCKLLKFFHAHFESQRVKGQSPTQ